VANKFRKREQVDRDLDAIWNFIAADNVGAADKLIGRVGEIFEMLTQNPLAGRERTDLRRGMHSFSVRSYVIFYLPLLASCMVNRTLTPTIWTRDQLGST